MERWLVTLFGSPLGCSADLRESCGEKTEGLVFVSGEGRSVAVEVARDTATGRTRAVTQRLYASLSLKLCNGERKQVLVSIWERPQVLLVTLLTNLTVSLL